jgi:uncharacterized protein YcsI (UPF0317 family)
MQALQNETEAEDLRKAFRLGEPPRVTAGLAPGYTQANLVILPESSAFDFLRFCVRNPKPCPVLEVTDPGSPEPRLMAPGADLRTDLPLYRVFRHGELVEEVSDVSGLWRDDLVAFLLGCSFTFEQALQAAGLPVRGLEAGATYTAYKTSLDCVPAGIFSGPMVVTMRPMLPDEAVRAVRVTSRYPMAHGAPVHIGDPSAIGIGDLGAPDFGDPVELRPGEIPVFWACGITPQVVALHSGVEFMITHAPGHMFITDVRDEALALR